MGRRLDKLGRSKQRPYRGFASGRDERAKELCELRLLIRAAGQTSGS